MNENTSMATENKITFQNDGKKVTSNTQLTAENTA